MVELKLGNRFWSQFLAPLIEMKPFRTQVRLNLALAILCQRPRALLPNLLLLEMSQESSHPRSLSQQLNRVVFVHQVELLHLRPVPPEFRHAQLPTHLLKSEVQSKGDQKCRNR